MKRYKVNAFVSLVSLAFVGIAALVTSCVSKPFDGIATTFGPMYDFTRRIVGDKMEVLTIVGENEPHGFSPNDPQITAKAESAKLLVAYGEGMDDFAKDMNDNYFVSTQGVEFKTSAENGGSGDAIDPHAWLSLKDSKVIIQNIANKVIEVDPDNKSYYESNLNKALADFTALDEKYEAAIGPKAQLETRAIVTSHEAFGYLAKDYGLTQFGIADVADNEPTAQRINEVVKFIKDNNVHTICLEELEESEGKQRVDSIAEEIHKTDPDYVLTDVAFSAYEGVNPDDWTKGGDYLSVMEENLKAIAKSLGNPQYQK